MLRDIESRWGRRISKGTVSYYGGRRVGRSRRAKFERATFADWDWPVGLYYSDGSKFKDKWKHTVVFCLSKTEAAVHSKLFVIMRKLGLEPSVLTRDGYGGMNVRIYNKDLFNALPKKSEAYYPRIPLAHVAGLFDGDGYFKEGRGESWVFVQAS